MSKVLGYRSIGYDELYMLFLANNPIYGLKRWASSPWTKVPNPPNYGVVCFFAEDYKWKDKEHKFDIVVELEDPIQGHGIYMASKALEKTHIWYGRDGKTEYKLPEFYVRSYSLADVRAIDLRGYFNESVSNTFKAICDKHHISFKR